MNEYKILEAKVRSADEQIHNLKLRLLQIANGDLKPLYLNNYQIANLRWALELIRSNMDKNLSPLNTGDWVGEIHDLLGDISADHNPNVSIEEYLLRHCGICPCGSDNNVGCNVTGCPLLKE